MTKRLRNALNVNLSLGVGYLRTNGILWRQELPSLQ